MEYTEFKGTKGEWAISGKAPDAIIVKNEEHTDAEYYGGELICESVKTHNRHIIAAAPDLLQACMMQAFFHSRGIQKVIGLNDAVIFTGNPFDCGEFIRNYRNAAIEKALNIKS
jgi:hypothetical protein